MVRILVVDDDADISMAIKNGLTRNGFEVDAYNEPEKAISEFKPDTYDLCILDIRMPKINGFDMYREIKKKQASIRVCFLSAYDLSQTEFKKYFPADDVKSFIQKPITISRLLSIIKSELNIT